MAKKEQTMSWTDDRIATLKKMWKDGKSAADIAKTLGKGVTRNAVIGKAHRMGLSGRPSPVKKAAAPAKTAKKDTATKKTAEKKGAKNAVKTVKLVAKSAEKTGKNPADKPAKDNKKSPPVREVETTAPTIAKPEALPPGGGVALIDLTERMCRWPIGDPRDAEFTFCGASPLRPSTPYCIEHATQAYHTSSRRSPPLVAAAKKAVVVEAVEDEDAVDVVVDDEDEDDIEDVG